MIQLEEYCKPSINRVLFNIGSIIHVKIHANIYLPNRETSSIFILLNILFYRMINTTAVQTARYFSFCLPIYIQNQLGLFYSAYATMKVFSSIVIPIKITQCIFPKWTDLTDISTILDKGLFYCTIFLFYLVYPWN